MGSRGWDDEDYARARPPRRRPNAPDGDEQPYRRSSRDGGGSRYGSRRDDDDYGSRGGRGRASAADWDGPRSSSGRRGPDGPPSRSGRGGRPRRDYDEYDDRGGPPGRSSRGGRGYAARGADPYGEPHVQRSNRTPRGGAGGLWGDDDMGGGRGGVANASMVGARGGARGGRGRGSAAPEKKGGLPLGTLFTILVAAAVLGVGAAFVYPKLKAHFARQTTPTSAPAPAVSPSTTPSGTPSATPSTTPSDTPTTAPTGYAGGSHLVWITITPSLAS